MKAATMFIVNIIRVVHVSTAIGKLKIDKVNDNVLIYSNLGLLYTSMVYHRYGAPPPPVAFGNIISIPKGSKASNLILINEEALRSVVYLVQFWIT